MNDINLELDAVIEDIDQRNIKRREVLRVLQGSSTDKRVVALLAGMAEDCSDMRQAIVEIAKIVNTLTESHQEMQTLLGFTMEAIGRSKIHEKAVEAMKRARDVNEVRQDRVHVNLNSTQPDDDES